MHCVGVWVRFCWRDGLWVVLIDRRAFGSRCICIIEWNPNYVEWMKESMLRDRDEEDDLATHQSR